MIGKKAMIEEIMICCKANEVPNLDDILLALAFRSESELIKICQELCIKWR